MDLGPTLTIHKGSRRRGKGPYIGVRLRGERWVSEIRIPKTKTRIWLGSHHSPEKAARAYDAALYCLKGDQGYFNFPNNKKPDLADQPVGTLPIDEIQCIAAQFSCLDDSVETSEPSPMSSLREARFSLEPPVVPDPQNAHAMNANNKVVGEPPIPPFVPEEPYIPTFVPEEPYVPAFVPEAAPIVHGNFVLDEWFTLDGEWMANFR